MLGTIGDKEKHDNEDHPKFLNVSEEIRLVYNEAFIHFTGRYLFDW